MPLLWTLIVLLLLLLLLQLLEHTHKNHFGKKAGAYLRVRLLNAESCLAAGIYALC